MKKEIKYFQDLIITPSAPNDVLKVTRSTNRSIKITIDTTILPNNYTGNFYLTLNNENPDVFKFPSLLYWNLTILSCIGVIGNPTITLKFYKKNLNNKNCKYRELTCKLENSLYSSKNGSDILLTKIDPKTSIIVIKFKAIPNIKYTLLLENLK